MSLNVGVQDHGGLGVAQGAPVLVEQVHQLLGDQPGGEEQLLPPELVGDVPRPPREELRHRLGGELGLTDVAKVPRQVNGLACVEIYMRIEKSESNLYLSFESLIGKC